MSDLFGVIHLPSLKSTSKNKIPDIIEYSLSQAILLDELGYTGVIIENFGDIPFAKTEVDDIVLTKLALICHEVKKEITGKIGLNILRNATVQAMKVASVLSLDFVRSNVWEGAYVTDQGIIEGIAYNVMETKNSLQSTTEVYADVFVKHATPLSDFSIIEAAQQALGRGGADRIIISGRHTGDEINFNTLNQLNEVDIFPMIGSGLTHAKIQSYSGKISGGIVGTAIKNHDVTSPINKEKAKSMIDLWMEHFS